MKILRWLMVPMLAVAAHAGVITSDNFDADPLGLNVTPTGWTTTNGSVDMIGNTQFGITCFGNAGSCVDLDGSTSQAGLLTWNQTFTLTAGVTYTLTYELSGNQRGGTADSVTTTFAGFSSTQIMNSGDAYTLFSLFITPGSTLTNQTVSFQNAGGDDIGAILDNVSLSSNATSTTPEPSTGLLLVGSLSALTFLRKKMMKS